MKKGFTLIELLAVIVILAVISLIAVPRIMDAIDESRAGALRQNNEAVIKAVQNYFVDNAVDLPQTIGETTEVSLDDLIGNDLINEISSPYSSNNCSGYILVTKVEGGHEFVPHINCFEDINSSSEDGLVSHYLFSEYIEPTENIHGETFTPGSNWSGTITREFIEASNFTWHLRLTNGSGSPYSRVNIPVLEGETYTFSLYVRSTNLADDGRVAVYMRTPGGSNTITNLYKNDIEGKFKRVQISHTIEEGATSLERASIQLHGINSDAIIEIADWQLEKKTSATPFTVGIRIPEAKDYSLNSNNARIDGAIPTENRFGVLDKALVFDGTNDSLDLGPGREYFSLGESGNLEELTIIGWVNPSRNKLQRITTIRNQEQNSSLIFGINADGTIRADSLGSNVISYINGEVNNGVIPLNEWSMVAVTLTNLPISNHSIKIGEYWVPAQSFDGKMDEFLIYDRVLSSNEIKSIYNTRR